MTRQAERHLEAAEASFGGIAETLAKALDLLATASAPTSPRQVIYAASGTRRPSGGSSFNDRRIVSAEVQSPS